ncbi:hypothetical protein [Sulfurimonas sp. CS5]|uniref:hypothetical protein n=1 Tax=Sulfurimonas sp. CS5 TaxID=3391145 RepID=UPI0039EC12A0
MTSKAHIEEIATIIGNEKNVVGKEPLLWDESIKQMKVYEIPLEHLVYNRYNGRILSRTKSIENSRDRELDMSNKEDFNLVAKLLWKSSKSRNNQTIKDINDKGQLKTGIITTDGVIIDGNRRAMLLNKLDKKVFRAIVLPISFDENPLKIEELETTYQMGEDEKLGYNPIEKYLKAQQLFNKLIEKYTEDEAIDKIKDWMGESKEKIKDYLEIVKLIDEYLAYLEYDGIYAMADTPSDGKEDLFLHLKKWILKYFDKQSSDGFDGYTNLDVEELKFICFDYIRAKIGKSYDGKLFREIADGRKGNHFFGDKDIWKEFKKKHNDIVTSHIQRIDTEMPIDSSSKNIESHLSSRDTEFKNSVVDELEENISQYKTELGYKRASIQPMKLTNDAKKALSAIDRKNKSFEDKDVLDDVAKVSEVTAELLRTKSIVALIDQLMYTLDALENVELKSIIENKEESLECLKELREIQPLDKLAYDLEKKIKAEK